MKAPSATVMAAALLPCALLLAGCGAGTQTPAPAGAGTRPPPVAAPAPRPKGIPNLIGQSADAVGALFGLPRLDVTEGAGRKLQFAGPACILDVYFYAPRAGAAPVATHIDARAPDGRDVDQAACVTALTRR